MHLNRILLLTITSIFLNSLKLSQGQGIKTLSSCVAVLDNGAYINLTSLDNPNSPRKSDIGDKYLYYFNPCTPLTCVGYTDVALCQNVKASNVNYDIGDQSTASFSIENDKIYINYQNNVKSSKLECACSTTESFEFIKENPINKYYLRFSSPCCCPNGCSGGPSIKTLSPCQAQLSDGSMIDLSSLNNIDKPITTSAGDYKYSFNLCSAIPCSIVSDAAICQLSIKNVTYNIGQQHTAVFSLDREKNPIITYKSSDPDKNTRTTQVQCLCGDVQSFKFVSENPQNNYNFILISPCCCPNGCNGTAGIQTLSPCVGMLPDSRVIDLSSLDKPNNPRTNMALNFLYKFNPCSSISCGSVSDTAVCQTETKSGALFSLGTQSSAKFSIDQDNVVAINYQQGDRKTYLACICGQFESFQFVREGPLKNYELIFISPCCCPDGCRKNSTTNYLQLLNNLKN